MGQTIGRGARVIKAALWVLLLGFLVTIMFTAWCMSLGARETHIGWTSGPYRGRVIDAQTKEAIKGAVVVAVWYYSVPAMAHPVTMFHNAVEVLTDAEGIFVVEAPWTELFALPCTSFPVFTIFKPGYIHFQGWFASPEAMADRRNRSLVGVVELIANTGVGRKARLKNPPSHPFGVSKEKIPNLLHAMSEEAEALQKERLP
jgi:hypothetical protein